MPQKASKFGRILPLIGACLLSAVGSLALHVAPFVTATLIIDGRASVTGAAWVRVATQLGEFVMALALPLLKIGNINRRSTVVVCLALTGGLALAGSQDFGLLLCGWLAIGACCSVLKHLGVMTASRQEHLSMAFSLRLSTVLVVAGVVAAAIATLEAPPYDRLLLLLAAVCGTLMAASLLLARDPVRNNSQSVDTSSAAIAESRYLPVSGLIVVFLFFTGISGVLVFVLCQAVDRGLSFQEATWSLAATKIIVGALLLTNFHSGKGKGGCGLLLYGALLLSATVGIHQSQDVMALFIGLLAWELAVNSLSTRLQVMVVGEAPESGARWLNLTILLGSVLGPVLNGYLISNGQGYVYGILGAVTAFAPAIWGQWSCRWPLVVGRENEVMRRRLGLGARRLQPAQRPTLHQP